MIGVGAKFNDADYEAAGAKMVSTAEVFKSDIHILFLSSLSPPSSSSCYLPSSLSY